MNLTAILIIFLAISNIEANPTLSRFGHHREVLAQDPYGNELAILNEPEPKEADGNLQDGEGEGEGAGAKAGGEGVEGSPRTTETIRQVDSKGEIQEGGENDEEKTRDRNWSGIELRDSRAGFVPCSHGTLISKCW